MYIDFLILLLLLSLLYGYKRYIDHVRICKTLLLDVNFPFMNDSYKDYCYRVIREYKKEKRKKKKKRQGYRRL